MNDYINNSIGGDFELDVEIFHSSPLPQEWWPSIIPNTLLLNSGRSAIAYALEIIHSHGSNNNAWLPAYVCPSVVSPFRKAGLQVHYYGMGSDLKTPKRLPHRLERGSIFLFIHYFGKKNQSIIDYLSQQDTSEIYIIEDCVQGCLSPNLGHWGNFIIHSFRKWLPVPDGALLASHFDLNLPLHENRETVTNRTLLAKLMRVHHPDKARSLTLEAEALLQEDLAPRHIAWTTLYLLERLNLADYQYKRRSNWQLLHQKLQSTNLNLQPLYEELEDGEFPLGYPVIFPDEKTRDRVRAQLSEKKIYCPVHWELPIRGPWREDTLLSQCILTLPIDQRLLPTHIERIVGTLRQIMS